MTGRFFKVNGRGPYKASSNAISVELARLSLGRSKRSSHPHVSQKQPVFTRSPRHFLKAFPPPQTGLCLSGKSVHYPESEASDIDYKDCRDLDAEILPPTAIWRTPIGIALSGISLISAIGCACIEPANYTTSINVILNGANVACIFIPQELNASTRVLSAATLASTTLAICQPGSSTIYTVLLAVGGTACLTNMGRVVTYDPQQGKGLLQLGLVLPAVAGIRIVAGPNLSDWHSILMTLGASTIAVGTSLQLTKGNKWIPLGLQALGCAELLAGFIIALVRKFVQQQTLLGNVHESFGAVAMAGLLFQIAFTLPSIFPGDEPPPKDLETFHRIMGKGNFIALSSALTSGFAMSYGWSGMPTVICSLVCCGITALLITPLWEYSHAAELSI